MKPNFLLFSIIVGTMHSSTTTGVVLVDCPAIRLNSVEQRQDAAPSANQDDSPVIAFLNLPEDELEARSFSTFAQHKGIFVVGFGSMRHRGLDMLCTWKTFQMVASEYRATTGVGLVKAGNSYAFAFPIPVTYRSKSPSGDTFSNFLLGLRGQTELQRSLRLRFPSANRTRGLKFLKCEYRKRLWMISPGMWATLVEGTVLLQNASGSVTTIFVSNAARLLPDRNPYTG